VLLEPGPTVGERHADRMELALTDAVTPGRNASVVTGLRIGS
jgi:hypothetical protein